MGTGPQILEYERALWSYPKQYVTLWPGCQPFHDQDAAMDTAQAANVWMRTPFGEQVMNAPQLFSHRRLNIALLLVMRIYGSTQHNTRVVSTGGLSLI